MSTTWSVHTAERHSAPERKDIPTPGLARTGPEGSVPSEASRSQRAGTARLHAREAREEPGPQRWGLGAGRAVSGRRAPVREDGTSCRRGWGRLRDPAGAVGAAGLCVCSDTVKMVKSVSCVFYHNPSKAPGRCRV